MQSTSSTTQSLNNNFKSCIYLADNVFNLKKSSNNSYHCPNGKNHKNNDKIASLMVYDEKFECPVCGRKGNYFDFIKFVKGFNDIQAKRFCYELAGRKTKENNQPRSNKRHVRFISDIKKSKFACLEEKKLSLKRPEEKDIQEIETKIKKKWSIDTLNKLNILISGRRNSQNYCIVLPEEWESGKQINHNSDKSIELFLEGRTCLISAVNGKLDEYFNLVSRFNIGTPIQLNENIEEHIFIIDNDLSDNISIHDLIESTINKIININELYKNHKFKFVLLDEKDLSDFFYNNKTSADLLKIINEAQYFEISEELIKEIHFEKELQTQRKNYEYTDNGNEERFIDLFGDRVAVTDSNNYIWDGKKWVKDTERQHELTDLVKAALKSIEEDKYDVLDDDEKEFIEKYYLKCQSEKVQTTLLRMINRNKKLYTDENKFNVEYKKILVGDKVIDLEKGIVVDNKKEFYVTQSINIEYNPDAKCDNFFKFLNTVFKSDDNELIEYVQRLVGYFAIGKRLEKEFYFFFGKADSGKTTFIRLIKNILGEYAYDLRKDNFLKQNSDRNQNPELLNSRHARVVISSDELEKTDRLNASRIKSFTGGDPLSSEYKYANKTISFIPKAKLLFYGNYLPIFDSVDVALKGRIVVIPFLNQIPKDKQIKDFQEKLLLEEGSGILNWIIEGAKKYLKSGLGERPAIVEKYTNTYFHDNDPLFEFWLSLDTNKKDKMLQKDLYDRYLEWHRENGEGRELGKKRFKEHCTVCYKVRFGGDTKNNNNATCFFNNEGFENEKKSLEKQKTKEENISINPVMEEIKERIDETLKKINSMENLKEKRKELEEVHKWVLDNKGKPGADYNLLKLWADEIIDLFL